MLATYRRQVIAQAKSNAVEMLFIASQLWEGPPLRCCHSREASARCRVCLSGFPERSTFGNAFQIL